MEPPEGFDDWWEAEEGPAVLGVATCSTSEASSSQADALPTSPSLKVLRLPRETSNTGDEGVTSASGAANMSRNREAVVERARCVVRWE